MVQNHAGVLSRVSGLFSRRDFNIDSLTVGETEDPSISRMTIAVRGDEHTVEQIQRQLEKLEDVYSVRRVRPESGVFRELALIKVSARSAKRADVINIAKVFRARVVDVSSDSLTVEVTGDTGKVDGLIGVLRPYGIAELARTGLSALERGAQAMSAGQASFLDRADVEEEELGA